MNVKVKKKTPQHGFYNHRAVPQVSALHIICVLLVVLNPSLLVLILPTYKRFLQLWAQILVLCLIKQPERCSSITTDSSGCLTHNRTALSHPTLFSKYVHKCTGEHQWAQRRPCWRLLLHPRIINPPSDRQAEPERLDTAGQVIYGSK